MADILTKLKYPSFHQGKETLRKRLRCTVTGFLYIVSNDNLVHFISISLHHTLNILNTLQYI